MTQNGPRKVGSVIVSTTNSDSPRVASDEEIAKEREWTQAFDESDDTKQEPHDKG